MIKTILLRSARSLKEKTDTKNVTFGASLCLMAAIAALAIIPYEYLKISAGTRITIGLVLTIPCLFLYHRYEKHAKLRKI